MGRQVSTNPADLDRLIPDEDTVDYQDKRPRQLPDQGRPRYGQQRFDVYGGAKRGTDPFDGCRDEPPTYGDDARFDVWKRLTEIAKDHAVKLRKYRPDRAGAVIDREVLPQVRKILRSGVSPERAPALVDAFTEFLWAEIEKK